MTRLEWTEFLQSIIDIAESEGLTKSIAFKAPTLQSNAKYNLYFTAAVDVVRKNPKWCMEFKLGGWRHFERKDV